MATFRKITASNVIEETLRKFVTDTEKTLIASSLQPGHVGTVVQAFHQKLQDATALTGDIVGTDDTQTITNKTIDVAQNTVSNIDLTHFASTVIDTDGTLAANSDTKLATQKAIKTYVDNAQAAVSGALLFKGEWDPSTGSFPSGADLGFYYKVSGAGTVDGVDFAVGDTIFSVTDSASTTTYADNWFKIDNTESVTSVAGKTGAVTLVLADVSDITATATEVNHLSGISGNVQSLLDSKLNLSAINTDGTFATPSDSEVPSTQAVKTYVDTEIAGVSAINSTKVSGALTVASDTITLAENAVLVSSVYVENEGTLATGFTHTSDTDTVTIDDTSLDTKTVYVTYSI